MTNRSYNPTAGPGDPTKVTPAGKDDPAGLPGNGVFLGANSLYVLVHPDGDDFFFLYSTTATPASDYKHPNNATIKHTANETTYMYFFNGTPSTIQISINGGNKVSIDSDSWSTDKFACTPPAEVGDVLKWAITATGSSGSTDPTFYIKRKSTGNVPE
ncbi:MAG: hypothetical protein AAF799_28230 [Myxococcota bacterium]